MQRTTVLLLFGGESSEHEISISSARNVYAATDNEKYEVLLGYIDPQGRWWLLDHFGMQIDTHGMPQLLPALGGKSFVTTPDNRVIAPDVILPILHGKQGEDGSVQGLAQLLHIPIVGCGVLASSLGMDKRVSKELAAAHHIAIVPYDIHQRGEPTPEFSKLSMKLGSPLFVKPACAGSSVGVSKVYSEDELARALDEAHRHDAVVLIEQAIVARELEVAILGTPPRHRMSGVGEVVPSEDFYSYDDKYATSSAASLVIPAAIDSHIAERVRAIADEMYQLLGCAGLARVDFFLSDDGTVYFNELNTLPGFTHSSMYPKLWREQGVSYPELVDRLIEDALGHDTIKEVTEEE